MNHTECHIQHALSRTRRHSSNCNVTAEHCSRATQSHWVMVNVVLPLHNLLTTLAVDRRVAHV